MHNESILHDPVTWVAAAFIIFLIGFLRLAMPHILKGLDNKSAAIARELEEARRLREEAEALLAEYKAKQKAIEAEARDMLAHAKKEAESMKVQAEASLKTTIERRSKLAQEKIARAQSDAVESIKRSVVAMAVESATTAAQAQGSAQGDALIEQALQGIERIVH